MHRIWQVRDPHVVLLTLPSGVRTAAQTLPVRVLSQVHEEQSNTTQTPGE